MLWAVVQWVGEDSVSVVSEKETILEEVESLVELVDATVSVITKNEKGKAKIFKAVVLKVFGTRSKALDYEKSILGKPSESPDTDIDTDEQPLNKRKRKPSKKILDAANSKDDSEEDAASEQTRGKKKKINESDTNTNKLQEQVQNERISSILTGRRSKGFINSKEPSSSCQMYITGNETNNSQEVHTQAHSLPHAQKPQQTTAPVQTNNTNTLPSRHSRSYAPQQTPPPVQTNTLPTSSHTRHSPVLIPTPNRTHAHETQQTPEPLHVRPTTPVQTYTANTPLTYRSKRITPPMHNVQHLDHINEAHAHNSELTPLYPSTTIGRQQPQFLSMLEDDDYPLSYTHTSPSTTSQHYTPYTPVQSYNVQTGSCSDRGDWNSFTTHFTSEFEKLKAEVDSLKTEVKNLKRIIRDTKANRGECEKNPEEGTLGDLLKIVENTTKPLDALKKVLFTLFSEEEVRVSSLKGVTTTAGGATVGLDKQKVDILYCVMEKRFPQSTRSDVDKWARGQQRKLREQYKKK